MNLYTELEKWNTGDIGYFQGTVKVYLGVIYNLHSALGGGEGGVI